jgi:hypothetical protein
MPSSCLRGKSIKRSLMYCSSAQADRFRGRGRVRLGNECEEGRIRLNLSWPEGKARRLTYDKLSACRTRRGGATRCRVYRRLARRQRTASPGTKLRSQILAISFQQLTLTTDNCHQVTLMTSAVVLSRPAVSKEACTRRCAKLWPASGASGERRTSKIWWL